MKAILLHINDDKAMEARKQVALDMARACGGHITCLQTVSYEVFAPGDFYGSAMAAAIPQIREAAEKLREEMEAEFGKEDVPFEWRVQFGAAEQALLEQSALHDIIIIGPHDVGGEGSRGPSAMAGELTLKAPTPVLVVPADAKGFDTGAPIMVAWNGSSEASVAMRQAAPLLEQAGKVFLAAVVEDKKQQRVAFPITEAANYLARRGVAVDVLEIPRGEAKISDTLFSAAQMRDCGMLVMGAYGHSRLAEMLLGGVTRRSLSDPQMPMFLGH